MHSFHARRGDVRNLLAFIIAQPQEQTTTAMLNVHCCYEQKRFSMIVMATMHSPRELYAGCVWSLELHDSWHDCHYHSIFWAPLSSLGQGGERARQRVFRKRRGYWLEVSCLEVKVTHVQYLGVVNDMGHVVCGSCAVASSYIALLLYSGDFLSCGQCVSA